MGTRLAVAGAAVAALVALGGCTSSAETGGDATTAASQPVSPTPTPQEPSGPTVPSIAGDVLTGLAAPWSIAFADSDTAFISERDTGRILLVKRSADGWQATPATEVPGVSAAGEGGLMGLAVSPGGDAVYAMLTSARDNRVVRLPWNGSALGAPEPVLSGLPRAEYHNGGRIVFGPDGNLYVATGDAGNPEQAQDPGSLAGKILRITPSGAVPDGNPIPGSPVWSWGHRNVQGLAFDEDGRLWASEFGAKDFDEINIIEPGANYGWPRFEGPSDDPGYTGPVAWWSPTSVASPSGIAIADGSVWVATLRGQTLYQVPITDTGAGEPIAWFPGQLGRLRDVVAAPAGGLWLVTNNTDGRGDPGAGDDRVVAVSLD